MTWSLAWRNLWRNPRRTLIILAAVVIGVWLMLFMGAYSRGMLFDMIDNSVKTLTGHVQIHAPGYLDDPSPSHSFTPDRAFNQALTTALPADSHWAPRVRLDTVAATARHSGGVTLIGIDFAREQGLSFLPETINAGDFPGEDNPNGIVVGAALLRRYETRIGHKLILTARDATGEVRSRAFRICGTYHARLEAIEKQFVFIRLGTAQAFFGLEHAISEIAILTPDMEAATPLAATLRMTLPGPPVDVATWRELLPTIRGYLDIWDIYLYIWNLIVFVAMAFGLTNTLLMAVYERMREFGLVRALGMKPSQVLRGVMLEATLLLFIGLATGNLLNVITVVALANHGIDMSALASGAEYFGISSIIYPVLDWRDFITANLMTLVLGLLVSLYPAWRAGRFTPIEAIAKAT